MLSFWRGLSTTGALAGIKFAQSVTHLHKAVTGRVAVVLIGLALWSSIRYTRLAGRA